MNHFFTVTPLIVISPTSLYDITKNYVTSQSKAFLTQLMRKKKTFKVD